MIGLKYGRYTVTGMAPSQRGMKMFQCRCDCGAERVVYAKNLKSGNSSSCGCLHSERTVKRNLIHGKAKSSTWNAWIGMRERCSPHSKNARWYSKRGIKVCAHWQKFENFLGDVGERPEGAQLDRINNDRGYEPGNCRWATPTQNSRNRSNNTVLTYMGKSMCVAAWAERLNLPRYVISNRLRYGWPVARVLSEPVRAVSRAI